MKKIIGILMLLISVVIFGGTQKAPNFTAEDQYGHELSIENFKGKSIILTFWATWCPACRSELGGLDTLYKKYGENKENVIFLGVVSEDRDTVDKFLKDRGYSYPTVISEEAMGKYYVRAFPTTYFIDSDGNVINYALGAVPEENLDNYIQKYLLK